MQRDCWLLPLTSTASEVTTLTYGHDILKINEQMLMQICKNGQWGMDMKYSALGAMRSKVTWGWRQIWRPGGVIIL